MWFYLERVGSKAHFMGFEKKSDCSLIVPVAPQVLSKAFWVLNSFFLMKLTVNVLMHLLPCSFLCP